MSIADKITELTTIRGNIRTALAGKGVGASDHNFGDFADDITSIQTGGSSGWQRPQGWPDLDAYFDTLPNNFVGILFSAENYIADEEFSIATHSYDTATLEIGSISGSTFTVEQTLQTTTSGYTRTFPNFTFSGIKVFKITSSKQAPDYCSVAFPQTKFYIRETIARRSSNNINTLCVFARRVKQVDCYIGAYYYNYGVPPKSYQALEWHELVNPSGNTEYAGFVNVFSNIATIRHISGIKDLPIPLVATWNSIFNNASSLVDLDISGWDTSAVTTITNMFSGCRSLQNFFPPAVIPVSISFVDSQFLTRDSLLRILNSLKQLPEGETQTLTLCAVSKDMLTDAEKQIATNKGWTIA